MALFFEPNPGGRFAREDQTNGQAGIGGLDREFLDASVDIANPLPHRNRQFSSSVRSPRTCVLRNQSANPIPGIRPCSSPDSVDMLMLRCDDVLMRTTVTIDDDILAVARAIAGRNGSSLGRALSELARRGLRGPATEITDYGLPVFAVEPGAKPIRRRRL